jgi:hypothetical protein
MSGSWVRGEADLVCTSGNKEVLSSWTKGYGEDLPVVGMYFCDSFCRCSGIPAIVEQCIS